MERAHPDHRDTHKLYTYPSGDFRAWPWHLRAFLRRMEEQIIYSFFF